MRGGVGLAYAIVSGATRGHREKGKVEIVHQCGLKRRQHAKCFKLELGPPRLRGFSPSPFAMHPQPGRCRLLEANPSPSHRREGDPPFGENRKCRPGGQTNVLGVMNEAQAFSLIREGLQTGLWVIGPTLLAITAAGLITSVIQALTQIQEQTVGFVVKVAVTITSLWVMGPWMLHRMADHLRGVLEAIAG